MGFSGYYQPSLEKKIPSFLLEKFKLTIEFRIDSFCTHTHKHACFQRYQNTMSLQKKSKPFFFLEMSSVATTEGCGVGLLSFPIPGQSLKSCTISGAWMAPLVGRLPSA